MKRHTIWLYRWITVMVLWKGDEPAFASFEIEATPLWVWEI
jgi:hypothetical protein